MYITGTWFAAKMFSNDIIILIICRTSCHLDFYKNWRSRDFKWRKSEITVLVFIDTLKRVQSCQRKVRATLTDRVAPNLLRTSFRLPPDKHHCLICLRVRMLWHTLCYGRVTPLVLTSRRPSPGRLWGMSPAAAVTWTASPSPRSQTGTAAPIWIHCYAIIIFVRQPV